VYITGIAIDGRKRLGYIWNSLFIYIYTPYPIWIVSKYNRSIIKCPKVTVRALQQSRGRNMEQLMRRIFRHFLIQSLTLPTYPHTHTHTHLLLCSWMLGLLKSSVCSDWAIGYSPSSQYKQPYRVMFSIKMKNTFLELVNLHCSRITVKHRCMYMSFVGWSESRLSPKWCNGAGVCVRYQVVLETEITNSAALRLYEKLGFVRDKRLFRYYLNGVDALRLKLWLK